MRLMAQKSLLHKPKNLLGMGTLAFSIIFHLSLMLMVGGVVLIEGVTPKAPIGAYTPQESSIQDLPPPDAEPVQQQPDTPQMPQPDQPVPDQPSAPVSTNMPDIVSSSVTSTSSFSVPPPIPGAVYVPGSAPSASQTPQDQKPVKTAAPDIMKSMASVFGSSGEATDALVGYMYDLKQTPDRKPTSMVGSAKEGVNGGSPENKEYARTVKEFFDSNWNPSVLEKFYKVKNPMSTYQIFIPKMQADAAPQAFKVQDLVKPRRWVIHYKGSVTAPITGTIRFIGICDDMLAVRFNSRMVLDGCLGTLVPSANSSDNVGNFLDDPKSRRLYAGQWFHVDAGQVYPMEVLIGEQPGGVFYALLEVQEQGKKYEERKNGGLVLPLFQTSSTRIPSYDVNKEGPKLESKGMVFNSASDGK